MRTRVIRHVVLVGLLTAILTGCGRQVVRTSEDGDDLLATTPDTATLPVRPQYITEAIDAMGGLPAWTRRERLDLRGIVTAEKPDGGHYLTEHIFTVYPWSAALRITAREPRSTFAWRLVQDRFEMVEGDASLNVSPLVGMYRSYATAMLQILTTPARLLDRGIRLSRQPIPVQIRGQHYDLIDVQFAAHQLAVEERAATPGVAERYWTSGTYFQDRQNARIDMIWLANPARRDFLIVRGYDYAMRGGVLVPARVEVFRSDAERRIGRRFAQIDLVR